MQQLIYKVPNGKLLKIFVDIEQDASTGVRTIRDIKITGDFFMHPEEKIILLEEALKGETLDRDKLIKKLEEIFSREKIEIFGADAESIVQTILTAYHSESS